MCAVCLDGPTFTSRLTLQGEVVCEPGAQYAYVVPVTVGLEAKV